MKKILSAAAVLAGIVLSAAEPVLYCDYTGDVPVLKSKFSLPVLEGESTMLGGKPSALKLNGKNSFITIPGSGAFTLKNGGTLYAVANISDKEDFGMMFFKPDEFLFGIYQKDNLYFNMGTQQKKKFGAYLLLHKVRRGAWTSYAVSVQVQDGDYHVTLYASGSKPVKRVFKKLDYYQTGQDVTFGRGFGWNWHLDGEVTLFMAFDRPLTEQEIQELDNKSPFKL